MALNKRNVFGLVIVTMLLLIPLQYYYIMQYQCHPNSIKDSFRQKLRTISVNLLELKRRLATQSSHFLALQNQVKFVNE